MFIGLVMPSSHLTLCHPLLLPPSIFLSIRVRWPKYWSFSFSICPSNEYSGLISSSILGTYCPGVSIFQCPIFLPLHTVHGGLKARILEWFVIPFSMDHILSELSTMTCLSWVALHGMAHSFFELEKAVVHVIRLVSFL